MQSTLHFPLSLYLYFFHLLFHLSLSLHSCFTPYTRFLVSPFSPPYPTPPHLPSPLHLSHSPLFLLSTSPTLSLSFIPISLPSTSPTLSLSFIPISLPYFLAVFLPPFLPVTLPRLPTPPHLLALYHCLFQRSHQISFYENVRRHITQVLI